MTPAVVALETLERLAALAPQPEQPVHSEHNGRYAPFDLEHWLASHGVSVLRDSAWKDGRRYILRQCVFDSAHAGTSSAIIQLGSGAIAYVCQHNGCSGRNWADVRELFEPGYRARYQQRSQFSNGDAPHSDNGVASHSANPSGDNADEPPPPHNIEAEQAVLGAVLKDNTALRSAFEALTSEDFYRHSHQQIFAAMLELSSAQTGIDGYTLTDLLHRKGVLQECGGPDYVRDLAAVAATSANIVDYAAIVRGRSRLRSIASVCERLAAQAYGTPVDIAQFAHDAAARMIGACLDSRERRPMRSMAEIAPEVIQRFEAAYERRQSGGAVGLSTGFTKLDEVLGGLMPGTLTYLAARPGMGKTALACEIVRRAGNAGRVVAFFSLEMSALDIGARLICAEGSDGSGIDYAKVRNGFLPRAEFPRLLVAAAALAKTAIYIDDSSAASPLRLRNQCLTLASQLPAGEIDLIVIDYLQLMAPDRRFESRQNEIAEISRSLKRLATEFSCPVMTLSQLNRECERRTDKHPILSDLRDSGAIEQDADVVMFLYRGAVYDRDNPQLKGVAEVIVAKQRNGPTDSVTLTFLEECMRFENYAAGQEVR